MGPKRYAVQCTVNGKENPKNCLFPLGFCHPAGGGPNHGHRQQAQKFGKNRSRDSRDMLADRHTHTHTHRETCILQYFATAPAGKVITTHYHFNGHVNLDQKISTRLISGMGGLRPVCPSCHPNDNVKALLITT